MKFAMVQISQLPLVTGPEAPRVAVNSDYPGTCFSQIMRDTLLKSFTFPLILPVLARSAEQGARSVVSGLSLRPESQGKLWWNDQLTE